METFERWADVPEHLKTKTGLNKAGLRRRPKQAPVAKIDTTWGSRGQHGGEYDLYDIREALKKPETTPEAKAAKAARMKQLRIDTHCNRCDAYVAKADKIQYGGLCHGCMADDARERKRRADIRQWAQDLLARGAVVLDTETTGLSDADRIVEIAIVSSAGATLFHSLINPEMHIYEEAARIHGITDAMVTVAPTMAEVKADIQQVLTCPVVIYNANFDVAFLRRAGLTIPGEPECLMLRFSEYFGEWSRRHDGWRWKSLDMACYYFHIPRPAAHRALADAHDAANVLRALAASVD